MESEVGKELCSWENQSEEAARKIWKGRRRMEGEGEHLRP